MTARAAARGDRAGTRVLDEALGYLRSRPETAGDSFDLEIVTRVLRCARRENS